MVTLPIGLTTLPEVKNNHIKNLGTEETYENTKAVFFVSCRGSLFTVFLTNVLFCRVFHLFGFSGVFAQLTL